MANRGNSFPAPLTASLMHGHMLKENFVDRTSPPSPVKDTTAPEDVHEDSTVDSRAYQLEMLEESIKRNIIVAMDTGSGKTHVAVLRIKHELQNSSSPKLIWFLTPTIFLCSQQFDVLQSQISSVQIKSLTSADNVDRWTEKTIWDDTLANIRIVVSTFAVLYDALCHAFVSMDSLALIVFDEAHNCVGNNPGSKIMRDFYWPEKNSEQCVPHILGLTASPVMGSRTEALETLELLLDSVCRSPRLHREDLLLHVKRPELVRIHFEAEALPSTLSRTSAMESLFAAYQKLNIQEDPEIVSLRTQNTKASKAQMEKLLLSKKTFVQNQMKSLNRRAGEMFQVLGKWAADFYILQVVSDFIQSSDSRSIMTSRWEDAGKRYLVNALRNVDISPGNLSVLSESSISVKVGTLVNFLQSCEENTTGIIFVKQRATASLLQHLLSIHPATSKRLQFDTVVGASQHARGKQEIFEMATRKDALSRFRSGEINILIATSVLEEGIDVPRCHLVICFDEPSNLKSYIQCRGRARLPGSRWVLLLDKSSKDHTTQWENLERVMKRRYEEEERNVQKLVESEASEKDVYRSRQFRVPSTKALLDLDNAKGHLQCFCSRLFSRPSVDMRPVYIIIQEKEDRDGYEDEAQLSAKVVLPAALDSSLQVFKSKLVWRSEKNAMKDAAFEAYVALYRAGLINDYLLPLRFLEPSRYMEKGESMVEVHEQFNPWLSVARAWKSRERLQRRVLVLKDQHDLVKCEIKISIPIDLPNIEPILIHWDASSQWKLESGPPRNAEYSDQLVDHTATLLSLAHGHRWEMKEMRHAVIFEALSTKTSQIQLGSVSLVHDDHMDDSMGLLRDSQKCGYPYLFHNWLPTKPSIQLIQRPHEDYETFSHNQPFVALKKWSRRSDFLHPVAAGSEPVGKEYFSVLPQSRLKRDIVPTAFSQFALLIPSFLHKIEVQLVVEELCATVLADIDISNTAMVRKAISTSAAREQDDYQKLEFLGDSVLKLLVSIFLTSKHPYWPEGYLSAKKDGIVSNSRLCKAAIDRGLDKFILMKIFTGAKWRPLYVDELLECQENGTREIPSKSIADVVESLIGAGWKMGDYQTSLSIAKLFLPEIDMPSVEVGRVQLFDLTPDNIPLPEDLYQLENLAGYSFVKKSLIIEAMSHRSVNTATASYDRLEFLGSSILEVLIVTEVSGYEDSLSLSFMHLCKTALVNGDYLGFIALEWSITQRKTCWNEDPLTGIMEKVDSGFSLPLWRFMRHGMLNIGIEQQEVVHRHTLLRHDILSAIESGTEYPWTLLASIHAHKFYSDIVESLLGAIWIDSGSIEACREILDRMGIINYLHRIVRDGVHLLHPREELGILASDKEVRYELHESKMEDGSSGRRCNVFVGETLIFEGDYGKSDDEARTRAAKGAVAVLKSANGRSGSRI